VTLSANTTGINFTKIIQDAEEGAGGDNTAGTASTIVVNATTPEVTQSRSLYPNGDVDWVKVTFPATTDPADYEFSANNLSNASDVVMSLYNCTDIAGGALAVFDDYIGLDSRMMSTIPAAGGDYCLEFNTADWDPYGWGIIGNGVVTYTFSVHPFIDVDLDTFSTYYDCDDTNNTVYPDRRLSSWL
jgi:hypothetical protein